MLSSWQPLLSLYVTFPSKLSCKRVKLISPFYFFVTIMFQLKRLSVKQRHHIFLSILECKITIPWHKIKIIVLTNCVLSMCQFSASWLLQCIWILYIAWSGVLSKSHVTACKNNLCWEMNSQNDSPLYPTKQFYLRPQGNCSSYQIITSCDPPLLLEVSDLPLTVIAVAILPASFVNSWTL